MILVDTSVWIDHFRKNNRRLQVLLEKGLVLCHAFVVGELACGNLKNRSEILTLLDSLDKAEIAFDEEVLKMIEKQDLMALGLGYIDVHLLASTLLSSVRIWTLDHRLRRVASNLGIAWPEKRSQT